MQAAGERKRAEKEQEAKQAEAAYRRFKRKKPPALRQATWDWLIEAGLRELPADGRLGPLLLNLGVLAHPELLRSTVIQLPDGTDYVIDRPAAEAIAKRSTPVALVRLLDRRRIEVSLDAAMEAIFGGAVFDQLDV